MVSVLVKFFPFRFGLFFHKKIHMASGTLPKVDLPQHPVGQGVRVTAGRLSTVPPWLRTPEKSVLSWRLGRHKVLNAPKGFSSIRLPAEGSIIVFVFLHEEREEYAEGEADAGSAEKQHGPGHGNGNEKDPGAHLFRILQYDNHA